MNIKIPYGRQTIEKDDINYVSKVLKSNFLTTGPEVKKFENLFLKKTKAKYAVSCSNGTAALHLSFLSIGLKKNDNVIMPAINFVASANMARLIEAHIFLADVDEKTGQVTKKTIEECIKKNKIKNLKLIIVMHHEGTPNYGKELLYLKKKHKCFIIEDACHSLGGKYSIKYNQKVGSCIYSDISTFSFHPVKSITTAEGGMLTTNNKLIFKNALLYRNHGMIKKKNKKDKINLGYKISSVGFNYRLSDINSALGINQLKKIEKFIKKRKNIAIKYIKNLTSLKNFLSLPIINKDIQSAWHLFVIRINFNKLKIKREKLVSLLYKKGITTQIHYKPIYLHPLFRDLNNASFKGANNYFKICLSIPIFPGLKNKDINFVSNSIKQLILKYKK